jgi:hypothetical protein
VVFVYFSNPVLANVVCARFIGTSRGLRAASSQHGRRNRGRLIQRFPNKPLERAGMTRCGEGNPRWAGRSAPIR